MCGIAGIVARQPVADRRWLLDAIHSIRHRGPDAAGEWWSADGRVGLGHRRLAIVDLSAAAHQPMLAANDALCIVFNGEIYNFVELRDELRIAGHYFRSGSDTEVVLAAFKEWGADCVARFNGMFALAIYDSTKRQLFMARDRAGEKPLFYVSSAGSLRFASELKALLADPTLPRRIDPESLDCYLHMGFVPGERCILEGVQKLPPAHALSFDLSTGNLRVWRYWQLPPVATPDRCDEGELLSELDSLLADAVRRQLVADVPVGILLSGGLDSSIVTAMACRVAANVRTFTIRFPGHRRYDETEHARLVARHFGTQHVELDASDSTVDLLPLLARQFDEPIVDSSMIPTYLISRLVREHCTVALGGDGGDELFGGYNHYSRLLWMEKKAASIPGGLRRALAGAAQGLLPVGFKGRNWLQGLGADLTSGVPLIARYFDRDLRKSLLGAGRSAALTAEEIRERRMPFSPDLVQRATRLDFANYLAEDILVKVDRASMLSSLEMRAPLLDYRLIEFAFGKVPSYLKAIATGRKVLLKRLAARVLPPEFNTQRKQGFSIPLGAWLQAGRWHAFFRDVLLGAESIAFDHQVINALLAGQARGRDNSERLFALVLFELWRREYKVSM
jgi:asparagine synthase (glutamine-hydrolysing)